MKTLEQLSNEYLEYIKSLNHSHYTIKNTRSGIYGFTSYMRRCEVVNSSQLLKSYIMDWQKHQTEVKTANHLPLKAASINKKIGAVKGFLKFLAYRGYVLNSIPEALRSLREPRMLPRGVVPHAEMRKLLRKIDTSSPRGYMERTILELMYSSALRAGEVVRLKVRDVNFSHMTVTVMGKGSKERIVPVGKTAMRFLETYIKAVRPFLVLNGRKDNLFLNSKGNPLQYNILLSMVRKHCRNLDIKASTHTFRRSCATELIRGNANLYHVKDMLGHESLETLKHYTKLTINDLRQTHAKCHPRERDS